MSNGATFVETVRVRRLALGDSEHVRELIISSTVWAAVCAALPAAYLARAAWAHAVVDRDVVVVLLAVGFGSILRLLVELASREIMVSTWGVWIRHSHRQGSTRLPAKRLVRARIIPRAGVLRVELYGGRGRLAVFGIREDDRARLLELFRTSLGGVALDDAATSA